MPLPIQGLTQVEPPSMPGEASYDYPRSFGSYLLLAPLARGGMGEVFLAKHGNVAGFEKHCVVKTLRPHLTDDREYTSRFIDEARIVVQLGHRNICHVFDVGTVGERYYLAMEYIAGKDLRALASDVGDKGSLVDPGLALHIVSETLEALDYAHRQIDAGSGTPLLLVHRDVSPQNVMLSWEGEVKLIDFGLAASTLKVEQTSPNVVMGKLAYMAPEQVRGERVDGRADLFAAGVMLYESLVGERFYEGRNPYEIWGIAAQGGYRPRGWGQLDAAMTIILDRALAGAAADRYPTCNEMREALQGYLHARGLRGDAPMLRALMHTVYAAQIEESRRTLALLTKAKLPPSLTSDSGSTPPVLTQAWRHQHHLMSDPTASLPRSRSIASLRLLPPSVAESAEPTETHAQPTFPSRRRPILAAMGMVALAALTGVVVSRLQHPATVGLPAPVMVTPAPAAPVAAAPMPLIEREPSPPAAEAAVKPEVRPAATKQRKLKVEPITAQIEVTPGPPVPPVPPVATPTWKSAGGWKPRVDALLEQCAAEACTIEVAKHRDDYGSLVDFKAWRVALRDCWSRCGLL